MFCLFFGGGGVEEKKAFMESSELKRQIGRKAVSNEIKHKYLGSSAINQGSNVNRTSHRIERKRAQSHKHPSLSIDVLKCKKATIERKCALGHISMGSSSLVCPDAAEVLFHFKLGFQSPNWIRRLTYDFIRVFRVLLVL
jgi:hypothetical protein